MAIPTRKAVAVGAATSSSGYDAFVSYSHAADGRLAPALQAGLQSLAKPWYRRRALRVFRDKTSLSASPELWPAIERALAQARYFVLLASPEAARSSWVDREVQWWRTHQGRDRVLIVLTDGQLVWNQSIGDFDTDQTNAIPLACAVGSLQSRCGWTCAGRGTNSTCPCAIPDSATPLPTWQHRCGGCQRTSWSGRTFASTGGFVAWLAEPRPCSLLLTVLASSAAVVAVGQRNEARNQRNEARNQARIATSRLLAATSQNLEGTHLVVRL
jgi:hypothetical protein